MLGQFEIPISYVTDQKSYFLRRLAAIPAKPRSAIAPGAGAVSNKTPTALQFSRVPASLP
jgi:hypothetical protein